MDFKAWLIYYSLLEPDLKDDKMATVLIANTSFSDDGSPSVYK